ncbi:ferredoxin [Amycolatopsis sp. FBCC-B4732]|uniref:ferredoxin n=1 Tax=Amycolatopsis sp. FBCC-B4732 TaxID=3079339 RepID=UPI001FF0F99B|nr:ferredoxin [Amycolatopsis sp. FBCC-B4732]UOX89333.1 ferredoxin [Amycolatopsis sp. FBCC-B4732]
MKITTDTASCVASGQCVLLAPGTFDQDEETGTVVLLTGEPAAGEEEAVRQAELTCPAAAIRLTGS